MAGGETQEHLALKLAARSWARAQGYPISALEVGLPHSNYRADAAAYKPPSGVRGKAGIGSTVVFECKQARQDLLRDARSSDDSLKRLEQLFSRRTRLERLLRVHYPHLGTGDSLFPEFERFDFDELEHKGYQKVRREIRILQNHAFNHTKLEKICRYRCANLHYLVVCPGIVALHEVPEGWGLLVQDRENPHLLTTAGEARYLDSPEETRLQFLHRVAAAASRFPHDVDGE